jgi:hypothetical protein
MPYKKLSELSDDELREVIGDLMGRVQEIEVHLAEAIALTLCVNGDVQMPTEQEYLDTVDSLTRFLSDTTRRMREIGALHERIRSHEYQKN